MLEESAELFDLERLVNIEKLSNFFASAGLAGLLFAKHVNPCLPLAVNMLLI